jgi:integrase
MRLTDIDRDVIKSFVRWMSNLKVVRGRERKHGRPSLRTPISPSTVQQTFGAVSTCLAAAVPTWLPVNPAARIPGERKNTVGLPKMRKFDAMFLEAWEVERILGTVEASLRDLVFVALRTGMRRGELITLQVRNVLFTQADGATVLVRTTLKNGGAVGAPKTECSVRDIPVSGDTAAVLRRLVAGKRPSGLVFLSPWQTQWHPSTLERHWYRSLMTAAQCPEHPSPVLA